MNKKLIIIAILTIFLTASLSSIIAVAKTSSEENQNSVLGLIESEISIEADPQIDKPLGPSETKEIELTVKYRLDLDDLAARLFFNRRIGRFFLFGLGYILKVKGEPKATINLSIADCPNWCTAELDTTAIELEIDNKFTEAKAKLQISVNETPPALELTEITVKAEYAGHWTIKGTSNTTTISFLPAYISNITYKAKTEQAIPPLKNTTIPINITNNGNGETVLNIEIENPPENWNISLDQEEITISKGDTEKIDLVVIPPKGFDEETIQLKLTPRSTSEEDVDDEYLEGGPISLSITLLNDGSLEEEEGIGIETILLIAFAIIIIVIVALILLLRRKKQ